MTRCRSTGILPMSPVQAVVFAAKLRREFRGRGTISICVDPPCHLHPPLPDGPRFLPVAFRVWLEVVAAKPPEENLGQTVRAQAYDLLRLSPAQNPTDLADPAYQSLLRQALRALSLPE